MENRNSSLWIGLGVGSVIGALAYRFSRTSKAKKLKEKVCDTFHKITGQAEDMYYSRPVPCSRNLNRR